MQAFAVLALCLAVAFCLRAADRAPDKAITIAQISDTHIGLQDNAPHADENLRRVVELVNARHPDAVIVSGDVGENTDARARARDILSGLRAKVYYVPGNHDVTADTVAKWRKQFGPDYYDFHIGGFTFLAVDSQLLGDYKVFEAKSPPPLSPQGEGESKKMLDWLRKQKGEGPVFVVQHIPPALGGGFPEDRPYWTTQEPYRSRELEVLRRLGVRHMFAGHWHEGTVFNADGITYHVAPATSWSPFGNPLGFALHTITPKGDVSTTFVSLSGDTFESGARVPNSRFTDGHIRYDPRTSRQGPTSAYHRRPPFQSGTNSPGLVIAHTDFFTIQEYKAQPGIRKRLFNPRLNPDRRPLRPNAHTGRDFSFRAETLVNHGRSRSSRNNRRREDLLRRSRDRPVDRARPWMDVLIQVLAEECS